MMVAKIRSFYGPSETMAFEVGPDFGDPIAFGTIDEAAGYIADQESGTYYLAHNEASRPEYLVVEDSVFDLISAMVYDGSMIDWDGCGCGCGACEVCGAYVEDQIIHVVRCAALATDYAYTLIAYRDVDGYEHLIETDSKPSYIEAKGLVLEDPDADLDTMSVEHVYS